MQTLVVYLTLVAVVFVIALLIVSVGTGGWVRDYEREYEDRTKGENK